VTEGLEAGERIVVSSNFLIDSESRMRPASSAPPAMAEAAAAKDPVCGMEVDAKAPNAIHARHAGQTYTFCSAKCQKDFEAAPGKYVHDMQPAPDDGGMRGTQ
jgi:YHS domain-containing protein